MPFDPNVELRAEINYAISVVDTVLQCTDVLQRNQNAIEAHLYAIALHVTILELLAGCIALAETGRSAGIPILLRSMYEALVDLDNLVHVKGYYEHMEAANLRQIIRTVRSPDLGALFDGSMGRNHEDLDALVDQFETLKKRGMGPLSFERRCRLAQRSAEYETLYGLFCLDAHNNLAALADRHIEELDPGKHFEIRILGEPHVRSVTMRLRFGVGFLIQSTEMIHGAFGTQLAIADELSKAHKARISSARP